MWDDRKVVEITLMQGGFSRGILYFKKISIRVGDNSASHKRDAQAGSSSAAVAYLWRWNIDNDNKLPRQGQTQDNQAFLRTTIQTAEAGEEDWGGEGEEKEEGEDMEGEEEEK